MSTNDEIINKREHDHTIDSRGFYNKIMNEARVDSLKHVHYCQQCKEFFSDLNDPKHWSHPIGIPDEQKIRADEQSSEKFAKFRIAVEKQAYEKIFAELDKKWEFGLYKENNVSLGIKKGQPIQDEGSLHIKFDDYQKLKKKFGVEKAGLKGEEIEGSPGGRIPKVQKSRDPGNSETLSETRGPASKIEDE